jgi:hypothetical protein
MSVTEDSKIGNEKLIILYPISIGRKVPVLKVIILSHPPDIATTAATLNTMLYRIFPNICIATNVIGT